MNKEQHYKEIFGPIIHKYLFKLDQYIKYLDDENTIFLYATRAGYRIKRLLEIYKNKPLDKNKHKIFIASRFLVAKSYLATSELESKKLLNSEYKNITVNDFIKAILKDDIQRDYSEFTCADYKKLNSDVFIDNFARDIHTNFYDYLLLENKKYNNYFINLISGRKRVVIIDSGWSGSIPRILSSAFSDVRFFSLFFGKIINSQSPNPISQNIKGIMFEINNSGKSNNFIHPNLETVFNIHRHLIEDLFEPSFPSIEYLMNNQVERNTFFLTDREDICFKGVVNYISENIEKNKTPIDIYKKSDEAIKILREEILYPNEKDIFMLGKMQRSLDFGKEGSCSVTLKPKNRFCDDNSSLRIKESIWAQGQIYIEYKDCSEYFIKKKQENNLNILMLGHLEEINTFDMTKVAIITRTMDRGILLERAKESIENQIYQDYLWIIINDGGDINPVLKVVDNSTIDPRRIIIINNFSNIGMEAASNRAISLSNSKYIIIHDDDDSWDPMFLKNSVAFLESEKGHKYGGVITDTIYVSETIEYQNVIIHEKRAYNDWIQNIHITEMACGNIFAPICFLFKKEIYNKLGGFDETLPVLGDWDFNLRYLMEVDIGVLKEPLAYYHHRDRGGNNGAYSNSVIGGISKHMEYAPIIKNKFIRKYPELLGLALSGGYIHQELREKLNSIITANNSHD